MSRLAKIAHQVRNESFSNTLLVIGLTVASVIVWFIVDFFYVTIVTYHEPMGLDIHHCYHLKLGNIPEESPEYNRQHPMTRQAVAEDITALLKKIQQRKDVEYACISYNASPYTNVNSIIKINFKGVTSINDPFLRLVSPEYVEVFRYHGVNGESPRQLAAILRKDQTLLSENIPHFYKMSPVTMTGQSISYSTHMQKIIGGIFQTVKYDEFNPGISSSQCLVLYPDTSYTTWGEISVRVRPAYEKGFIDRLNKEADKTYRIGNIYISEVNSYETMRSNYLSNYDSSFNRYQTGLAFILINVFLGLYGTFSFRTWQRREETGLMKVLGATNRDIAFRLFAEALLLLTVATIIAVIIDLNLTHLQLNGYYNGKYLEGKRFIQTVLISYAVMAITILLSVLLPAVKAVRTKPIDVLKHD